MLPPPPASNDDEHRISSTPLPPLKPGADPDAGAPVPQGDELFAYILECLENGSSRKEIRAQLLAFGYAAEDAEKAVADVADWRRNHSRASTEPSAANSSNGGTQMLIGGAICLIGIVVTAFSFMAAGDGGGRYLVAWGAIVFGAIQFFRGAAQASHRD